MDVNIVEQHPELTHVHVGLLWLSGQGTNPRCRSQIYAARRSPRKARDEAAVEASHNE